jgi:uncharacterized membrane protein
MSFKTHPKYPSILAMSDTFEHYGISSVLAQVPKEKWEVLPNEFIAMVSEAKQNKTAFVSKKSLNEFIIQTLEGKKKKLTLEEFLEVWSGIVLGVNENQTKNEKIHLPTKKDSKYYQIAFLLLVIVVPFFIIRDRQLFPWTWFYTLLSFLGLYLNIQIIKKRMGFGSDGFKKICSFTKKSSCDDVILSGKDRLFFNLSFSDLSAIYFIFSFLMAFLIETFQLSSELLGLTIMSIPVLLYSLFVQIFRLKSICMICLMMSGITILQIAMLGMMNEFSFQVDWHVLPIITLFFLAIALLWMMWKENMHYFEDVNEKYVEYHHLIRKEEVYQALEKDSELDILDKGELTPILLNEAKEGSHDITIIVSPKCTGCSIAYKDLRKVLSHHATKIEASLIFDLRSVSESIKAIFARMVELSQHDTNQLKFALDDWFLKQYSEKRWIQKWGTTQTNVSQILKHHQEFLTNNNIYHTPVTFVDNKQLSPFYSIKDAVYFMNHVVATS